MNALQFSDRITCLPIIHGSGDFALEVRRLMLSVDFDCLAVPLPPSFQSQVERAIAFLPNISFVLQEESSVAEYREWSKMKKVSGTFLSTRSHSGRGKST